MVAPSSNAKVRWSVAGACVRGASHERAGLINQDAFEYVDSGPETPAIAAISDGHGSRIHFRSHIGSSLAVSTAISTIQAFFRGRREDILEKELVDLQRSIADGWRRAVISDLQQRPFTDDEMRELEQAEGPEAWNLVQTSPEIAYGATLLVTAATERQVAYLQLGDGEILAVDAAGRTWRPLPPDERLSGNQTTSLCQPEAWKEFRVATASSPNLPALVLLSTDGYVNSFRSDDDFLQIGQDYLRMVREEGIAALRDELPAILAEASRQGSGDDISLGLLQGDIREPATVEGLPIPPSNMRPESRNAPRESVALRGLQVEVKLLQRRNRRMVQAIVLLCIAVLAVPAVLYRQKIASFWQAHRSSLRPVIKRRKEDSAQHQAVPIPGGKFVAPASQWTLRLSSGEEIPLEKGKKISWARMGDPSHGGEYAEVAMDAGRLELINRSQETWTVTVAGKTGRAVKRGGSVPVEAGTQIVFHKSFAGSIVQRNHDADAAAQAPAIPFTPVSRRGHVR